MERIEEAKKGRKEEEGGSVEGRMFGREGDIGKKGIIKKGKLAEGEEQHQLST